MRQPIVNHTAPAEPPQRNSRLITSRRFNTDTPGDRALIATGADVRPVSARICGHITPRTPYEIDSAVAGQRVAGLRGCVASIGADRDDRLVNDRTTSSSRVDPPASRAKHVSTSGARGSPHRFVRVADLRPGFTIDLATVPPPPAVFATICSAQVVPARAGRLASMSIQPTRYPEECTESPRSADRL